MTKLVMFSELQADMALPHGIRTKVFDTAVPLPAGDRQIRLGLQGGVYMNWFDASPNIALRVEFSLLRTTMMALPVVLAPTAGGETPAAQAAGIVRFTGLEEGTAIPLGAPIRRGGGGGTYSAQATVEASGGAVDVPVIAGTPGRAGNCVTGTPFYWGTYAGEAASPIIGGADLAPSPTQFVHRMGNTMLLAENARGPNILVEVYLTDIAARASMPGAPIPDGPWMLCGREGPSFGGTWRWPWRLTVEDLEWTTEEGA